MDLDVFGVSFPGQFRILHFDYDTLFVAPHVEIKLGRIRGRCDALPRQMEKSMRQYAVFLKTFREARRRSRLTQVELAKRFGETQSFVSKCERGERQIDLVELRTFSRAFGLACKKFLTLLNGQLGDAERSL